MKRIFFTILGLLISQSLTWADFNNDLQFWNAIRIKQGTWNNIDFDLQTEFRSQDTLSEFGLFALTQKATVPLNDRHRASLAFTYETSRSSDQVNWRYTYRPEIELSSRYKLSEAWQLDLRNRMEFTFREGSGSDVFPRYRGRVMARYNTDILPRGKWVGFGNEFFYDFHTDTWNQNRTFPLSTGFKLSDSVDLEVYYMINTKRAAGDSSWDYAHVIGFNIALDFWK